MVLGGIATVLPETKPVAASFRSAQSSSGWPRNRNLGPQVSDCAKGCLFCSKPISAPYPSVLHRTRKGKPRLRIGGKVRRHPRRSAAVSPLGPGGRSVARYSLRGWLILTIQPSMALAMLVLYLGRPLEGPFAPASPFCAPRFPGRILGQETSHRYKSRSLPRTSRTCRSHASPSPSRQECNRRD